jgi:hypothetical protein
MAENNNTMPPRMVAALSRVPQGDKRGSVRILTGTISTSFVGGSELESGTSRMGKA